MKFLKKQNEEEPPKAEVKVIKVVAINMQCLFCDEWDVMEGGPTGDGKASFICPKCGQLNTIKWNVDA